MYQQFINENRAHQYQQDCLREAATERALGTGRHQLAPETAHPLSPRPALAWLMFAVRRVAVLSPAGK